MLNAQNNFNQIREASDNLQAIVQVPIWPMAETSGSHHQAEDSSSSSAVELGAEPTTSTDISNWPSRSTYNWNATESLIDVNESLATVDSRDWNDGTTHSQTASFLWSSFSSLDVGPQVPEETRRVNLASRTGDLLFQAINRGASTSGSTLHPEADQNDDSPRVSDSWGWEKPRTPSNLQADSSSESSSWGWEKPATPLPEVRRIMVPRTERTNPYINYANGEFQVEAPKPKGKKVQGIALKSALKKVNCEFFSIGHHHLRTMSANPSMILFF